MKQTSKRENNDGKKEGVFFQFYVYQASINPVTNVVRESSEAELSDEEAWMRT